ncbi:MAG: peptidase [Bacteroidetes bacterium]|nr:peptidase [Bacteroidota bacterium]
MNGTKITNFYRTAAHSTEKIDRPEAANILIFAGHITMNRLKRLLRWLFYTFFVVTDLLFILLAWFIITVTIKSPVIESGDMAVVQKERSMRGPDFYTLSNSWIKKSETGLWEIYVEGDGFERGVTEGKLNKELAEKQEVAFVDQLQKMIPSRAMLNYLKFFIGFFNRNIDQYVIPEYKEEIYGESLYASDKFDFIAPKYYRMLNYHAAHDIGHALQDKNMTVGCTAFGAWGDKTDDGTLIIGRNFDFYVGDAFAEDKLINFVKPKDGYKFMMVSWAGMIGAVSGMNEKGLTVTLNASKSEIPTSAATPISLVAREILQYAKNIKEAMEIAKKRKTFVSESLFIGSAADKRTATIEKTPSKTELFESPEPDYIICANHYQGKSFETDKINMENKEKSSSYYRYKHLDQLIRAQPQITVNDAAAILRNRTGMDGKDIGMGNEKSLNQLIAHHAVIFKPERLQVWVSTNPFQLGQFVCYDLNKIFAEAPGLATKKELYEKPLNIPADPFLYSAEFARFKAWKRMKEAFHMVHKKQPEYKVDKKIIDAFISYNPESWETYAVLGDYYNEGKQPELAMHYYSLALEKEITTVQDKEEIQKKISKIGGGL